MDKELLEENNELKAVYEEVKKDIEKLRSDFASIRNNIKYLGDQIEVFNISQNIKNQNRDLEVSRFNDDYHFENRATDSKIGDNNCLNQTDIIEVKTEYVEPSFDHLKLEESSMSDLEDPSVSSMSESEDFSMSYEQNNKSVQATAENR